MSIFKRLKIIGEAKANAAMDKAEDPRQSIDLYFTKCQEQVQATKQGIAEVAGAKARLGRQLEDVEQKIAKLDEQKLQAVSQGRDDLAKAAIERRRVLEAQRDGIKPQYDGLATKLDQLTKALSTLERKVSTLAVEKESMKATYTAAQASVRVNESIAGIGEDMGDIGLAMQRAKDKTEALQAKGDGLDELLASGAFTEIGCAPGDDLQRELDAIGQGSVDDELASLKAGLNAAPETKALASGNGDNQ